MRADIRSSSVQIVSIRSLTAYPDNARQGDIETICDSLQAHGQYRPLVVQVGTSYILAGNQTFKAMKKLGFKKVKVVMVEADEQTARRIVLADNRSTDLANYDETLLKSLLLALPDLAGTGFTESDVEALNQITTYEPQGHDQSEKKDPTVSIGMWKFLIEQDAYDAWKEAIQLVAGKSRHRGMDEIMSRLGFPERPREARKQPVEPIVESVDEAEAVNVNDVLPHPYNPRQGDVGAITESLKAFGQYRPLVVNRRTMRCLSGNHTLQAMASLGWEKVAVTYVDVDDEEEIRILLVDNRSSDLATYSTFDFHKLLQQTTTLAGTGFTMEEVAEILAGGKTSPRYSPVGRTNVRVGDYTRRVHNENLNEWAHTIYQWSDVAELLGMPEHACHVEER